MSISSQVCHHFSELSVLISFLHLMLVLCDSFIFFDQIIECYQYYLYFLESHILVLWVSFIHFIDFCCSYTLLFSCFHFNLLFSSMKGKKGKKVLLPSIPSKMHYCPHLWTLSSSFVHPVFGGCLVQQTLRPWGKVLCIAIPRDIQASAKSSSEKNSEDRQGITNCSCHRGEPVSTGMTGGPRGMGVQPDLHRDPSTITSLHSPCHTLLVSTHMC